MNKAENLTGQVEGQGLGQQGQSPDQARGENEPRDSVFQVFKKN